MNDINLSTPDNQSNSADHKSKLTELDKKSNTIQSENSKIEANIYKETLNKKILQIKLIIKKKFPELSKFLVEIPSEVNTKISLDELTEYYVSLEAVLTKYKLDHPPKHDA